METDDFKDYIVKLENFQNKHPYIFKWRLLILLSLGYCYMFFVLLVLIGFLELMILGSVVNLLCLFVIPFIVILIYYSIKGIIRIFTIRVEKPKGVEITRVDAPILFNIIDLYRKELKCPKIHKVLVDNNENAYVSQIPLLGVFGPIRNYMVLGMPLMMQLGKEHMKAVLAHEMGHISHLHSKFGYRIFHVTDPWVRFVNELNDMFEYGDFLYIRFFNWFIYRTSAGLFVLKRANEHQADKEAARLTSRKLIAQSLALTYIFSEHIKRGFWDKYYLNTIEHETVQPFYSLYLEYVNNGIAIDILQKDYEQLIKIPTEYSDTHPSYLDRITAIGETPSVPEMPITCAAEELFIDKLNMLLEKCESIWAEDNQRDWKYKYRRYEKYKDSYNKLSDVMKTRELSSDEGFEFAECTKALFGMEKAYIEYLKVIDKDSSHPDANYIVGQYLLQDGNSSGIQNIKLAINHKIQYFYEGSNLIHSYLIKCGKNEEAEDYLNSQDLNKARFNKYYFYHNRLTIGYDKFSISTEIEEMIRLILSSRDFVKAAHLAIKIKIDDKEYVDTYLLLLQLKRKYFKKEYDDLIDEINFAIEDNGVNILIYQPRHIRDSKYIKAIKKYHGIKVR
jgi:Zn-dependent protease with chaperone function